MAECDVFQTTEWSHDTSKASVGLVLEVGVSPGAAAEASEIRKRNSNDGKCGDLGWVCTPLVFETYGAWGQEAVKSFAQLASRLAITCSKPKSVITRDLYGGLNTCRVRSVASAILSRIEPPLLNCSLLLACYIFVLHITFKTC